jgi:5S rRNA maturation endonuclease (ribonuclease M5)
MSYTPGTKLSHTDISCRATVLTGDNVMVTAGLGYGQMMKLADWLILADGAKIQEEFIPLPTASAPLPVAAPPPAIGSKLRWTLDANTYRVAIMTAKGLLQVKSVTDGASEFHPTTCRECTPCKELAMTPPAPWARRPLKQSIFADEAAWRASLPTGGSVEITPPAKPVAEQKVAVVAQAPNDVEKLKAAIKTYKIRTTAYAEPSPQEQLKAVTERMEKIRAELAALTLDQDIEWPHMRHKLTRQLKHARGCYISMKIACNGPNSDVKNVRMSHRGTGRISLYTRDEILLLTVHEDKIAATYAPNSGPAWLFNNFAEISGDDDFNLLVIYRGRRITL